jgi:formylglycine-generating enzyme required for sulfatase activity
VDIVKRTCVFIFFCLCFFVAVFVVEGGEVSPLLVITDLRTVGGEASIAEARAFSEFCRQEIEKTGMFRVVSRSSMMSVLEANAFPLPCHERACFVRMGRMLGADQVLAGFLQRHSEMVEITLRLIDVKKSQFKKTVYHTAPHLSTDDLLSEWGRNIVWETFSIDPSQMAERAESASEGLEPKKPQIPDSVKYKYEGMTYIPAGEVIVGSNNGDECEQPSHTMFVEAFYIGTYEVTNQEYREFVDATGHRVPRHWAGGRIPRGMEKHPVYWVSYEDAEDYSAWKGGRLPTEVEWERAAKGGSTYPFPWGYEFDKNRANTWEAGRGGTTPVGSYPLGASPFGVEDMAGNVFEWVADFYGPYPGSKAVEKEFDKHLRVLRGGSWNFNDYYARTTHRLPRSGGERSRSFGFRLVREN